MSRVFEALARAGEEKHGQVQRLVEKIESAVTVEPPVEGKGLTPEPNSRANGWISKTNGAVHEITNHCPRSRTAKSRGAKKLKNGSWGGICDVMAVIQSWLWKENLPHRNNIKCCASRSNDYVPNPGLGVFP